MTRVFDDPARFADDALAGFVSVHADYVRRVNGGVVRASPGGGQRVAVVTGGGSGHYPAYAGFVGAGMAAGSACGAVFASPSAEQIDSVARASSSGGGILFCYGNYTGDNLNFGMAEKRLRADGFDVRTVTVTDDIASSAESAKRRGTAGCLTTLKVAGAAADAGLSLDEVERLTRHANDRSRTLGVALSGCTLPGAREPGFTVPTGMAAIGLGIHGEPGIDELPLTDASQLARVMVQHCVADQPAGAGPQVVAVVNSLGCISDEELFVLAGPIIAELRATGIEVVDLEAGRFVTSLDMAGLSLTLFWLDDELRRWWNAPVATPAFRRSAEASTALRGVEPARETLARGDLDVPFVGALSAPDRLNGRRVAAVLAAVADALAGAEKELADLDAIAGDGDHGSGMTRGSRRAAEAARDASAAGAGTATVLRQAGHAWGEHAGGTSGALWGTGLVSAADYLTTCEQDVSPHHGLEMLETAVSAVCELGGAGVGDKTLVDALIPYRDRFRQLLELDESLSVALRGAADASADAAIATAALRPRIGRARPLAERSLGHADPGATSLAIVADIFARSWTATPSSALTADHQGSQDDE